MGLLLVQPFPGAAAGEEDWLLPAHNELAGQVKRAWDGRGSPWPLLPSPFLSGLLTPSLLPGGFSSDSALPGQKLIAEGLRSHLCF